MFLHINEPAIVVSALLAAAVGSIWYSPLVFGTSWMKTVGLTAQDEHAFPFGEVVKGIGAQLVFFLLISQFIPLVQEELFTMMQIGALLTLIIGSHMLVHVIMEKRPLSYFLITIGYTAITVFGGLAVITYWPW